MLDLKTLFVILAIITSFITLALFFYGKSSKIYPGFQLWSIGTLSAAVGYLALFLRGDIPVWISILIVNGAVVTAGLLRLDGITRFLQGVPLNRLYCLAPAVAVLFAGYYYFVQDSVVIRVVAMTGWVCLFSWAIAAVFFRAASDGTRLLYYAAGGINVVYGLSMLARTLIGARNGGSGFLASNVMNSVFFILFIVYEIWLGQLILIMNNQRMEAELKLNEGELREHIVSLGKAISEVKVLKGLLPICSTCKKIRDDQGYWNQLESYIDDHSEASFTHGICPECSVNFRREIEEYRCNKNNEAAVGAMAGLVDSDR